MSASVEAARARASRAVPPQEIRFCTAGDGVRLAYATMGDGPPLVKVANWLSHLDFDRETTVWRHWLTELSKRHRLVRYDERGCGLTDWDVPDLSFEAWVSDLEAVVDAAGLDRFPLLGISQGGPVAVAYAVYAIPSASLTSCRRRCSGVGRRGAPQLPPRSLRRPGSDRARSGGAQPDRVSPPSPECRVREPPRRSGRRSS